MSACDNEVIFDSEEEQEGILSLPSPTRSKDSSIQSAAFSAEAKDAQDVSTISSFSSDMPRARISSISNSTHGSATAAVVTPAARSRPRPKPAYKSLPSNPASSIPELSAPTTSHSLAHHTPPNKTMRDEINSPSHYAFAHDRPSSPSNEKLSLPKNKADNFVSREEENPKVVEVIELTSDESDHEVVKEVKKLKRASKKKKEKGKGKGKEKEKEKKETERTRENSRVRGEDEQVGRVKKRKNRIILDSDDSDGTRGEKRGRVTVSLGTTADDADGEEATGFTGCSPDNLASERKSAPQAHDKEAAPTKENIVPIIHATTNFTPTPAIIHATSNFTPTPAVKHSNRPHSIGRKSTPMSELIRRVNSYPSSPFPVGSSPKIRLPSLSTSTAYSPLLKSSRSLLSQIAPLHPNRRTPPPPLPKPPPPKKSKKQLALEEKWEEELSENVEGWAALSDRDRAELRKAKWEMEMGDCD